MIATINLEGILIIQVQTDLEGYALKQWYENNKQMFNTEETRNIEFKMHPFPGEDE